MIREHFKQYKTLPALFKEVNWHIFGGEHQVFSTPAPNKACKKFWTKYFGRFFKSIKMYSVGKGDSNHGAVDTVGYPENEHFPLFKIITS